MSGSYRDSLLSADHCRSYALSDSTDKDFRTDCRHDHKELCENCEALRSTFDEIEHQIKTFSGISYSEDQRQDDLHDFNQAKENIFKWKTHIMRSINQEQAKQHIIENLDDSSALIVMDWAMKFTQLKYREKQSDWFGKRGLSWHVSSVVTKDTMKNNIAVTSYVHLFDACTQDWFSVCYIAEDLLRKIKSTSPTVSKLFIRSDEAGCYHNNLLITALKDISKHAGVTVQRYDFSEPQQGKDICDRIICPLKFALR